MTKDNYPKPDKGWRFLEHTADIRLEVHGDTLADLFLYAAAGLKNLISSDAEAVPETELEITLEAGTSEELLVDWLRELLFISQTRQLVMVQAQIKDLSEINLKARVYFGTKPSDVETSLEIKGVTYHGLSIEKNTAGYSARIVFDI